jgi:peptide deformylase
MNLVDEYDPVLRLRSPEFSFQDSLPEERQRLVDDMFETMFANNGIGLAAPQVGISTRLFVMASTQYGNIVCYNPEVKVASDELANGVEGCLSFPDLQLSIKRAILITGKFQDVTGKEVELTFEGIDARCFLHELDHLDGVVFTTKVGPTTLQLARQRQSKQKRTKHK